MSGPLVSEGSDLEQLLADIRAEHGDDARILYQDSVRRGGVMGFFAQEIHRIVYRVEGRGEHTAAAEENARALSAASAGNPAVGVADDPFQALLHSVIHTPENTMASAPSAPRSSSGSYAAAHSVRAAHAYTAVGDDAATDESAQAEWLESLLLPANADDVYATDGATPYAFASAPPDVAVFNRKPAHAAAEQSAFTEVGTGSRPYSTVEFEVMQKFPVIQSAQERFAELLRAAAEEQAAQQAAAEEQAARDAAARQTAAREAAAQLSLAREVAAREAAVREAAAHEAAAQQAAVHQAAVREAAAREALSQASTEALARVAAAREAVAAASAEIAAARLAAAQEAAARDAAAERQAADLAAAAAAQEAIEIATSAAAAQDAAQAAASKAAAAQEAAYLAARRAADAQASAETALRAAPPRSVAAQRSPVPAPQTRAYDPTASPGLVRPDAQVVNLPASGSPEVRAKMDLTLRLREVGVPASIHPRGNPPTVYDALDEILTELPAAPSPPRRPGEVLLIIGDIGPALRAAQSVARTLRLQDEDIWIADMQSHPILQIAGAQLCRPNTLSNARQAARVRGELLICDVASVVVLATEGAEAGDPWIGEMIGALRPTAVWACVDATRKSSDTAHLLSLLGDIDALVVHSGAVSSSPASVLEIGIPVALLDDRAATAANWSGLLTELLRAGAGSSTDADLATDVALARHRSA